VVVEVLGLLPLQAKGNLSVSTPLNIMNYCRPSLVFAYSLLNAGVITAVLFAISAPSSISFFAKLT